jgi:phosphoribosylformylglycinamidine synthase subunit PurQ / glutaminase
MSVPKVAVVQFPGVNCETESERALHRAGLEAERFRWTRPPGELRAFDAYLLPGGFSYQDRVRAGALAAKDPLMDVLAAEAERGKPVIGICNGAQVLVESGLVPGGGTIELALARNRMPDRAGYYAGWVLTRIEASPCVFTKHLEAGTLLPMPVAHGEGRFTSREPERMAALLRGGQVPLRYAEPQGEPAEGFPANPNGAETAAAAVCNERGNVLALMPHPERAQDLGGISRRVGARWGEARDRALAEGDANAEGPGMQLFHGLALHLKG